MGNRPRSLQVLDRQWRLTQPPWFPPRRATGLGSYRLTNTSKCSVVARDCSVSLSSGCPSWWPIRCIVPCLLCRAIRRRTHYFLGKGLTAGNADSGGRRKTHFAQGSGQPLHSTARRQTHYAQDWVPQRKLAEGRFGENAVRPGCHFLGNCYERERERTAVWQQATPPASSPMSTALKR